MVVQVDVDQLGQRSFCFGQICRLLRCQVYVLVVRARGTRASTLSPLLSSYSDS